MENIIELNKVTKKFGGVTALNKASLHVKKGEVVGLIGDNAVDPPLAPTQRPLTSGSQQIINSQQDIEVEEENRSFFDIITLGIFN